MKNLCTPRMLLLLLISLLYVAGIVIMPFELSLGLCLWAVATACAVPSWFFLIQKKQNAEKMEAAFADAEASASQEETEGVQEP